MKNSDIIRDKNFKHPYINRYILKNFPDCKECYVIACLNPSVYAHPGYYLSYDSDLKNNKELFKRRFRRPKDCAIAFFKSEYRFLI